MLVGYLRGGGDRTIIYKGGTYENINIERCMTFEEYVEMVCNKMNVDSKGVTFSYTLPFEENGSTTFKMSGRLQLHDQV